MKKETRQQILKKLKYHYGNRGKLGKTKAINEAVEMLGYDRKYAIKVLRGKRAILGTGGVRRGGRRAIYGEAEEVVLRQVWSHGGYPCGKRLVKMLPLWIGYYEKEFGELEEAVKERLMVMSAATADRLLVSFKVKAARGFRKATKPGSLTQLVEVRMGRWEGDTPPGHIETDTVSHCGGSTLDGHCNSLTATDINTGWTENRAFWNKGAAAILVAIADIEKSLPFPIISLDSDNGSEFINHPLYNYLTQRNNPIKFTRSRPYRKNDQAHVEQKNWTHVRNLIGYERLGHPDQAQLLNKLYREVWSDYNNLFCTAMKRIGTTKNYNGKNRPIYDTPATPLDRLIAWVGTQDPKVQDFIARRDKLNPFALSRKIKAMTKSLFSATK